MSDVWAFGITLWEVFTNCEMPYGTLTNAQVVEQVTKSGLRLPKPHYTETTPENVQVISRSTVYITIKYKLHHNDKTIVQRTISYEYRQYTI